MSTSSVQFKKRKSNPLCLVLRDVSGACINGSSGHLKKNGNNRLLDPGSKPSNPVFPAPVVHDLELIAAWLKSHV